MINLNKENIKSFFLTFLIIQLYVSLGILPFLIEAGIPFYLLSFLGNLIFTPFLILFLVSGLIVFICLLLQYYPLGLISLLEKGVHGWMYILSFSQYVDYAFFLKKCPYHMHFFICWIPLLLLYILKRYIKNKRNLLILLILSFVLTISFIVYCPKDYKKHILLNHEISIILTDDNKIIINDPYVYWRQKSYYNYLKYNVISEIIKEYGTNRIDIYYLKSKYKNTAIENILQKSVFIKNIIFN